MFDKIKELSWGVLGLVLSVIFVVILVVLFRWGVVFSAIVLPFIQFIAGFVFTIDLIILLPLSLFKRTREFSAIGFLISSYILGVELWLRSLLLTYILWGLFWVFIGLAFFGIGVLPMAILATLFNKSWAMSLFLLLTIIVVYGMRSFAIYLANKTSKEVELKDYLQL